MLGKSRVFGSDRLCANRWGGWGAVRRAGDRKVRALHRRLAVTFVVLSTTAGAASATAGDAQHGQELYQRYCTGCHGPDGQGGGKGFMPHVNALTRKGYIELLDDEYLKMVIAEGGEAFGKSAFMPSWKTTLSKQDIADIVAFIRTLPPH